MTDRLSQSGATDFTGRDREIYAAHSLVECDGLASTRQIAEKMDLRVAAVAARLSGMARRGLVVREGEQMWDDTADWMLTWHGCKAAEEAVPEHIKLARWLDATEHEYA